MPRKAYKVWNATVILLLIGLCVASLSSGNSIMDIINMERVEKLLAERRENASLELEQERRLMLQNSVDGEESFLNNENVDNEVNSPSEVHLRENSEGDPTELSELHVSGPRLTGTKKQKSWHHFTDRANHYHSSDTKSHRIRQNFTGIPDVSSLLADFAQVRVDKLLKSDRNTQLVTKKEYVKKDWCKTEPILQKIREDGCLGRTILNRFCYGQCNSFYIPKNPPRRKKNRKKQEVEPEENAVFKSCGFCKPKRASWIFVTLRCPNLAPQFKKKRVQRIKQCKCLAETFK